VVVVVQLVPVAAVIVGARSIPALMTSSSPIADFTLDRGGTRMASILSVAVALAMLNALVVGINVWARVLFASARDRSWPRAVDRALVTVHPSLRTPVAATLVIGAACLAASLLPFQWVVTVAAGIGVAQLAVVSVCALRVRTGIRSARHGFRMPIWPWPAVALAGVSLFLLYQLMVETPVSVAVSLAIVALGILYYYVMIHPYGGERWTLPSAVGDDTSK